METILTTEEFDLSLDKVREVFADGREEAREVIGLPTWAVEPEGIVAVVGDGMTVVVRGATARGVGGPRAWPRPMLEPRSRG